MRTLSSILALCIIFATLAAVPAPAWAGGLRVERQRADLLSPSVSPETDLDDSLPLQGRALAGVLTSAALPARFTTAARCAQRRVSHRAPYVGDADRCRDP